MSQSVEQQKQEEQVNNLMGQYAQQFKAPILSSLATFNQSIPNAIDQLSQRCVQLTIQNQTLTEKVKSLELEKNTAKTPKIKAGPDAGKN